MSDERTIDELIGLTDHLPEDWTLRLDMTTGCLDLHLRNPDGDRAEIIEDGLTFEEMFLVYINHARSEDGLGPVDFEGEATFDDLIPPGNRL